MAEQRNYRKAQQAKKNPAGAPPSIVLNQIDVRPWTRREQDVTSWRNAHRSAESYIPRRLLLYDLYADVELDGHVEAVTGKRRDAVTTANWQFVDKEGKPVDAINQLIDSVGFEELLEEIINSKFWGYSILEPTFYQNEDGSWEMSPNLIPRLNYRPELGIVAKDSTAEDGINIREGYYAKTIMEVGKVKDLGLYLKAAPYQVLKRGGLGDWALFVQVFGNPIVDATWDGFDEGQRLKLLEAITALGSGGALVRPAGTDVKLIENKTNANGDLQDKFMSFLNKEISKALLGSTETTESSTSSGYAQSQTHADQDERKNESDINFTRRILNSRFMPILKAHGFDVSGGRFIIEGEDNELTVKESFDMQMRLLDKGLPIDDDFFYETYGIPKPANYNQIKKEKEAEKEERIKASNTPPSRGNVGGKTPPSRGAGGVKLSEEDDDDDEGDDLIEKLKKLLVRFFGYAPAWIGAKTSTLKGGMRGVELTLPLKGEKEGATCCSETHLITLADPDSYRDHLPDIGKTIRAVAKADGKAILYPELVYQYITLFAKAFVTGWKGERLVQLAEYGIEYGALDPKMQTAWEMNIFKFSTVKAAYESKQVNELFRKAKNFAEFERMVRKLYGVQNRNWLITEYNTAYQTAEAASTYYRLMGQLNTFPYWQYKTIGDDRVRDSHRPLHDVILPANHPLWRKIFPPNGWGCRCYVVPRLATEVNPDQVQQNITYVTSFIETDAEWAKSKKSGFAVNRAEIQEVFTKVQQYSSSPDKVLKKVLDMGAKDWKLKEAQELQQAKPSSWQASEPKVIDELWDRYQVNDTRASLPDYAARPVSIEKTLLAKANMGDSTKYQLLGELEAVLKNPDEVWINDLGGGVMDSFVYIRYYPNQVIRVVARLDEAGNLQITGWDSIQDAPEQSRRGLVVKR
jgi:SPP1 gp7 family putative phage head morphogenesis protein